MVGEKDFWKTRDWADLDLYDPHQRDVIEHLITLIRQYLICADDEKAKPSAAQLAKASELLKIILDEGFYKLPRAKGQRHSVLDSDKQLMCWYRIYLEHEHNYKATKAKALTAERFRTTEKTIERYWTEQGKIVLRLIENHGWESISPSFKRHLASWKYRPVIYPQKLL